MIENEALENEIKKLTEDYVGDESVIDYERLIKDFGIDIDGIEKELTNV